MRLGFQGVGLRGGGLKNTYVHRLWGVGQRLVQV